MAGEWTVKVEVEELITVIESRINNCTTYYYYCAGPALLRRADNDIYLVYMTAYHKYLTDLRETV